MDFQKVTTGVTAAAVIGTGATVGGNHFIDQQSGGPQKRQDAQIEAIRQVVKEEVYLQLVNAWPSTSGPVKGLKPPTQNYKQVIPQSGN
tara:strand:- start:2027 stop:2293 length:267 start_codon:yes stop_codon:yes gene_type:complete